MTVKPICLLCKGSRNICGKDRCELLDSINARFSPGTDEEKKRKDLFGPSPPHIFVGRYGYPSVSVGPMLAREAIPAAWRLNSPQIWFGKSIEDIITFRSELVRSKSPVNVRHPSGRVLEVTQELAMAERPVDTEVVFEKEILLRPAPVLDPFAPPRGPSVGIRKAELAENPRIPRKVEAIVSDTDVPAVEGAKELYTASISPYHLQRLLSAGLLGQVRRRRLVPTRWSITAMDDILGKELIKGVKEFQEIGETLLYKGDYAGNYFHILFLPRQWSFEVVETWLKGAFWASETASVHDHEGYNGRKGYAFNVTGGYYAARLPVLEHLHRLRRQATVIINREITPEYWAPLGVWVIRETVRRALQARPLRFQGLKDALSYINRNVRKKNWTEFSALLKEVRTQRRLEDFLSHEDGENAASGF